MAACLRFAALSTQDRKGLLLICVHADANKSDTPWMTAISAQPASWQGSPSVEHASGRQGALQQGPYQLRPCGNARAYFFRTSVPPMHTECQSLVCSMACPQACVATRASGSGPVMAALHSECQALTPGYQGICDALPDQDLSSMGARPSEDRQHGAVLLTARRNFIWGPIPAQILSYTCKALHHTDVRKVWASYAGLFVHTERVITIPAGQNF